MNKQKITAARLALVAACLLLSGCASDTPYRSPTAATPEELDRIRAWMQENCQNPFGPPGAFDHKMCGAAAQDDAVIRRIMVEREKAENKEEKTWACAEGHSCR